MEQVLSIVYGRVVTLVGITSSSSSSTVQTLTKLALISMLMFQACCLEGDPLDGKLLGCINNKRLDGPSAVSPVTSYIKLKNPKNQKIYYRIKTTEPKRYSVIPNIGVLKPKEVSKIAVCLQPCEFNLLKKEEHKFMVQSVIALEGDTDDFVDDVWTDVYPDKIMNYELKCVFEHPTTNTTAAKPTAPNAVKSDTNSTDGKSKVTSDAYRCYR